MYLKNVLPFSAFTFGTPSVPAFYWKVKSQEQRILEICKNLDKLHEYCEHLCEAENATRTELNRVNTVVNEIKRELAELNKLLDDLAAGGRVRNAITGEWSPAYVAEKQLWDASRVYACTWAELKNTGLTWDDIKALGHSNLEIEMFGNLYLGDGTIRAKFTPTNTIDDNTPGFGGSYGD